MDSLSQLEVSSRFRRHVRYLLRFDDICATMNWDTWGHIERAIAELDLKPILAVVPDNLDPVLEVSKPVSDFWLRVRTWQSHGWSIGLHGYQHRYVTKDAGLMGINRASEFAGLAEVEQKRKLAQALSIFAREQVRPDIWIAPAHSFDRVTVKLLKDMGITVICDGFFPYPHRDSEGIVWVPQQLWSFRWRPCGVWTICTHHNSWSAESLNRFLADMRRYRPVIGSLDSVVARYGMRRSPVLDAVFSRMYQFAIKTKCRIEQMFSQIWKQAR